MKRPNRFAAIAAILVCPACLPAEVARADDSLWVGVFENVNGGNFLSPAMASPHVRVAFKKDGAEWVAAPSAIPQTITWTVVFDGRALGTITSSTKASLAYGDVNTQALAAVPANKILVREGAAGFSYTGDVRTNSRPLVVVSQRNFKDPEGWKPAALSPGEKQLAVKAFRSKIPTSERCDQPEQDPIHPVSYPDAAIRFLKAYRSKGGDIVLGLTLDDKSANCGFFDDENFFDYWFVLRASGQAQFLDSQMTPMDAVDLDNSGKSEWIFLTSRGEDRDGYELFYDDFSKKVAFSWAYH
ncbi:MAG: hypothetical protein ACLPTM_04930 [Steroidobacteraceae bacterium]